MIDIDRLERLAKASEQGNWIVVPRDGGTNAIRWSVINEDTRLKITNTIGRSTADHIAACNPGTVLQLIQEIRALRSQMGAILIPPDSTFSWGHTGPCQENCDCVIGKTKNKT